MGLQLVVSTLSILVFLCSTHARRSRELSAAGDFDVTSAKYGAHSGCDITEVNK